MPVFRIVYTTARTNHAITETLEWVTDGSWSADRTRREFTERHPDTALLQLHEVAC